MEGMYQLMQCAKYSNTYRASSGWYSELGFSYAELQEIAKDTSDMNKLMKRIEEAFESEMEDVKVNGYKEETNWWTTSHTSVYDINNRKLWVTVRERYDEEPYEFGF